MVASTVGVKPVLIYDGDCGFCKKWIDRWSECTQDSVEYAPFQKVKDQYPQISLEAFQSAVQLAEPDGRISSGAEAVFRTLSYSQKYRRWITYYLKCPGVKPVADAIYKRIASNRPFFSALTKILWGNTVETPQFSLSKIIFFRFLSIIYFIAFLSIWTQIIGLVGESGILPVGETMKSVHSQLGAQGYWWFPTLCWLNPSDWFLQALCGAGAALSVLLCFSVAPAFVSFLLWAIYLSIVTAGQEFLSFQWDALLLEVGFLAIFLAPQQLWPAKERSDDLPRLVHFAFKWLLFRLMFSSGIVKWASGDPAWRHFTALIYHYETQPLPPWTAWYAHQLPLWFQKFSTGIMFAIEIVLPVFLFLPKRARHFASAGIIFLMILIMLTGNYCFFNLLTIALACLMIDDSVWRKWFRLNQTHSKLSNARRSFWNQWVVIPASITLLILSLVPMSRLILGLRMPAPVVKLYSALTPFSLVNHYGLFAVMTKERPEIVVEGSDDGMNWKEYTFKYKMGDVKRAPKFVAPFQPRLDWQMWFAALGNYRQNPWFINFCIRLLEGRPEVLKLIERNPFPEHPPKMIRSVLYQYHFADNELRRKTGAWWTREEKGMYAPMLSLKRENLSD